MNASIRANEDVQRPLGPVRGLLSVIFVMVAVVLVLYSVFPAKSAQTSGCNSATGLVDGRLPDVWTRISAPQTTGPCSFVGTWSSSFPVSPGDTWTLNANGTGTVNFNGRVANSGCQNIWPVTVTVNGMVGFTATATNPGGGQCDPTFYDILTWAAGQPSVTLSRRGLTAVQATGTPSGGTFAYPTTPVSGRN